jgi:hypothetical protein
VLVGPFPPTQRYAVRVHVAGSLTRKVEYTVLVLGTGGRVLMGDVMLSGPPRFGMAPCVVSGPPGPLGRPQVAVLNVVTVAA